MRPWALALGALLALLAFAAWPTEDVPIETSSVETPDRSVTSTPSALLAVALAAASLAMFLQGFRPRSKAVARALGDEGP